MLPCFFSWPRLATASTLSINITEIWQPRSYPTLYLYVSVTQRKLVLNLPLVAFVLRHLRSLGLYNFILLFPYFLIICLTIFKVISNKWTRIIIKYLIENSIVRIKLYYINIFRIGGYRLKFRDVRISNILYIPNIIYYILP